MRIRTQVGVAVEGRTSETGCFPARSTRGERQTALTCNLARGSCPPSAPVEGRRLRGPVLAPGLFPPAFSLLLLLPLSLCSCCSADACHYQPLAPKLAQPQPAAPKNWTPDTRVGALARAGTETAPLLPRRAQAGCSPAPPQARQSSFSIHSWRPALSPPTLPPALL